MCLLDVHVWQRSYPDKLRHHILPQANTPRSMLNSWFFLFLDVAWKVLLKVAICYSKSPTSLSTDWSFAFAFGKLVVVSRRKETV